MSMFRANDIRTPASRMPDDLARRLSRAEAVYFGKVLGVSGVVVAHDARASGPHMLDIAADEYLDAGLNVIVLPGVSGVCQLYYAAMRHPDLAAVMFGASHNPAGDTGRKIVGPGVRPIAADMGAEGGLNSISRLYRQGSANRSETRGRTYAFDALPGYIAYSMIQARLQPGELRGVRVLHDYVYGAGGRELMLGFQAVDADLEPLHFACDGLFRLGDPNPVKQDVIAPGLQRLRDGGHDMGMFYDGDADRLDVYLRGGRYLTSSFIYAAILPELRRRASEEASRVIVDAKTSPLAALEMARCGAQVTITRSGHSHIKDVMHHDPTVLGAVEESAHFYGAFSLEGRRYCTENTLFYSLLVACVFRESPERFDAMIALQSKTAREREWGHSFPSDANRDDALMAVADHFRSQGAAIISQLPNGLSLEGTLMRIGLPFEINEATRPSDTWLQVSQRASQSEDGLARWEVVASSATLAHEAKRAVKRTVSGYGAGPEYQG